MKTLYKNILILVISFFLFPTPSNLLACSNDICYHHATQIDNLFHKNFSIKSIIGSRIMKNDLKELIFPNGDSNRAYRIRTVVIDAGHGGKDPGCSGKRGSSEKKLALEYALTLGDLIQKEYPNIQIVYTRKTDVFIELHERADIANNAKADLFISIHCNWNPNTKPYGTETYVLGLHRAKENLEVAKRENSSIYLENDYKQNYDGFDPNSTEGNILLSMSQNAHIEQSISFAEKIETEFKDINMKNSRGVRQAGFLVLRRTSMPAVLIETGFLSNIEEESYMSSQDGKNNIVKSIFNGFIKYKKSVEFNAKANELEDLASTTLNKDTPTYSQKNADNDKAIITETQIIVTDSAQSKMEQNKTEKNTVINAENTVPTVNELAAVEYCLQLYTSKNIIDMTGSKWIYFKNIIARSENGLLKYQAVYSTIKEVNDAKIYAKGHGFPDAFVCYYQNGVRVVATDLTFASTQK